MTLLDSRNYTVGWICALPVEMAAATAMLDEEHGKPTQQDSHDKYTYTLGKIGQHNVVIACLPDGVVGTTSAAALGVQMRSSFRCIRFGLMIGVGGGVPSRLHDIRLGDVVVSKPRGTSSGVIQYDYGKAVENGQLIMDGSLDKPPKTLLTAMSSLEADHLRRGNGISGHISKMLYKHPHMQQHFKHQGLENDILYAADYKHTTGFHCAQCDPKRQVIRAPRNSLNPAIFYGTIGYDDDEDLSMMDGLRGSGSSLSRRPTIALENINMDALPSSIFELASRLYAKEDISLASLIPDRRYPNQDALVEIQLEERKDYSISIDRNFSDFVKSNAKSNSGFKRALSKIFLSPAVKEVGGDVQILAEESRVYMMRQPREIFKKLSGRQSVRDWLTDYYMNSDEDIYFIVGYRTLVNAQFMATDLKVNQKTQQSRSHPGARENYRYETTGERIYAICFRRVSITSLRNGTPGSMLDSTNYWKTFAEDRGMEMDTEEEILSADLDEEDDLEEEAFGITTGGPDDSELELVV
ncbi:hypothetical protein TWF788_005208 [Orbilia oligospora]|uniref:Nucleoside phosphorylase domain-containing protein n=1 Tax=Orbilia oligospora TaxID=2813651 RepID=A0A7C8PZD3_ORBOL|nr:hypothetical protein TWF788_005208 [Orbilia oligospora]